jgi:hypothetical protein
MCPDWEGAPGPEVPDSRAMCHHVLSHFVRQCNTSQKSIIFRDLEVVFGKRNLFFGVTTATEVSPVQPWSYKTILFLRKVPEQALTFSKM